MNACLVRAAPPIGVVGLALACTAVMAQQSDDSADLAKKLSNPIASLISVPIKLSWDTGIGPENADRTTLVVQPVIPFSLNKDWNLITRTIVPFIHAQSPVAGGDSVSGMGDITQSFFLSPTAATSGGWIWGAGPVFTYPTASKKELGGKWGIGPTAVVLKQENGWTYGGLANHIWSVAGGDGRADVSATFLQPFLSFTTKQATTYAVNTESTYDWKSDQWTVPLNLQVSQLMRLGKQPVSLAFNFRQYLVKPDGGPDWGLSFQFTLLFPK